MITPLDRAGRQAFYRAELLRCAPRFLSRVDRCPLSAASGSADREYWAWATKDFANLDMQRGIRALAYLHARPFPGNLFAGAPALLTWIGQMARFWAARQAAGGAFDHLYLNENSWMAAAFTLVDMAAAFDLVGAAVAAEARRDWLAAMERTAGHLMAHDERHAFISNHRAAGAAGLASAARIFGNEMFLRRAAAIMDEIYARQSREGWYVEYGGADPGYQTLDTHYQGCFWRETGEARALASVERSLEFLSYFIHPDGSLGGEYGSRACPHVFPGGLEVFAPHSGLAEAVAGAAVAGLAAGTAAGLNEADGRNEVPMLTSYALALEALDRNEPAAAAVAPPLTRQFERAWPEAGLYVRNDGRRQTVIGAAKGGVIKVFDLESGGLVFASAGYAGRTRAGQDVTTHLWTSSPDFLHGLPEGERPGAPERRVVVRAPFYRFRRDRLMSPLKFLLFRLFNNTIGRVLAINNFVRRTLIVGRYIGARTGAGPVLERVVSFAADGSLDIADRVTGGEGLAEVREYGFLSTVYMASAKYFRAQDMAHAWEGPELAGAPGEITCGRELGPPVR